MTCIRLACLLCERSKGHRRVNNLGKRRLFWLGPSTSQLWPVKQKRKYFVWRRRSHASFLQETRWKGCKFREIEYCTVLPQALNDEERGCDSTAPVNVHVSYIIRVSNSIISIQSLPIEFLGSGVRVFPPIRCTENDAFIFAKKNMPLST